MVIHNSVSKNYETETNDKVKLTVSYTQTNT